MPTTDRVYLDHAATTPLDARVLEAMQPYLTSVYGNASSLHREGSAARDAVEQARERVAACLGAQRDEVYFTSGGTEGDNLAVFGLAATRPGRVICSAVEHHAVLHACEALAEHEGRELVVLPVDGDGRVDPASLDRTLAAGEVAVVSVMAANNETGAVQPLAALASLCERAGAPLHTDAVQCVGKLPFDFGALGPGLTAATFSGHKLYGPKGTGAMLLRAGAALRPRTYGGRHELGLRPGTENVAGVVGLATALELCCAEREVEATRLARLRDQLREGIAARIPDVTFNTPADGPRLPHIVNVSFAGIEGEALLLSLNIAGFAVATGSACTSEELEPSHVLRAMGRPDEVAQGSLRFSLGRSTTEDAIARTLDALERAVGGLRALSPVYEQA